jgi:hypothetical protein
MTEEEKLESAIHHHPGVGKKRNMKQTQTIPETFLGIGYARDRAGLPVSARDRSTHRDEPVRRTT